MFRILHFYNWFRKAIRNDILVQPLHRDGCGGLSFVGIMLRKLTIFASTLVVWSIFVLYVSFVWNHDGHLFLTDTPGLILNSFVIIVVYISMITIFLLFPTFQMHSAMVRSRDNHLLQMSVDPTTITNHADPEHQKYEDMYSTLANHLLIKQLYPTLPFTNIQWRVLRLTTAVPPIVGVASGVAQFIR